MSKPNDTTAFPHTVSITGPQDDPFNAADPVRAGTTRTYTFAGMSLRDYFAAKAMQTLCGVPVGAWPASSKGHGGSISVMAFEIADAMLVEREKS